MAKGQKDLSTMKSSTKTVVHFRSAKTGQYVTPQQAQRSPSTTVRETDKVQTQTQKKGK